MSDVCFHCGLPVPAGRSYPVVIAGEARAMCCPGCQAVAAAIVDGGLEQFYRYRSADSRRPDDAASEQLAVYDLPEMQQDFVTETAPGVLAADLAIAGISCSACAWLIERHLSRITGVTSFQVNGTTHRCHIEWESGLVLFSDLLRAFADIGYEARPAGDSAAELSRQRENRHYILRLGVAGIAMMQVGMVAIALYAGAFSGIEAQWQSLLRWTSLVIATPVVLYSAQPFFSAALRSLRAGVLVMDVPVALAIGLAFAASAWATLTGTGEVYFDSVAMFTFFLLLGRYLEMRVRHRNDHLVADYARLLPDAAVRLVDGRAQTVPVRSLQIGDLVQVAAGQTLPCDGEVVSGRSSVVEAVMTGEQTPVTKVPGSPVSAGTVNAENPLQVRVTATGTRTRLAAIMALVQRAQSEKPRQAAVADRLAGVFVAVVLLLALLVVGYWWQVAPDRALWVTLSVLVVTCPCALSLATPVALAVATGVLRRQGFLIHRAHVLEALARVDTCILDKTGTLTLGDMQIETVIPDGDLGEDALLAVAATLERDSRHPIARAFRNCAPVSVATEVQYSVGEGIVGRIDGRCYAIGKPGFVSRQLDLPALSYPPGDAGLWLAVAVEIAAVDTGPGPVVEKTGVKAGADDLPALQSAAGLLGWIGLSDRLRPGAGQALDSIRDAGIELHLLSGDHRPAVARMAARLGVEHWIGEASPTQKLDRIRTLQQQSRQVMMVGDGINDVPVLSAADISVAMADASDFTRLHADSLLLSGDLSGLATAIAIARRTAVIIRQNLCWALAYNGLALPLAVAGLVPPWAAAIGMSGSSLLVVVNALRLNRPASQARLPGPVPARAL